MNTACKESGVGGEEVRRKPGFTDICRHGNAVVMVVLAIYFLLIPGGIVIYDLSDPNIRTGGIPKMAWRVHRHLTPRYERWARRRIASGKAANLQLRDVPSTEWPMFGSVFYLWATESLQKAWEKDHALAPQAPKAYARGAIEAATDLVLDPVHHTWVRTHWGDGYLHRQNVFFRTLIIAALTTREELLGDGKHLAFLEDQTESLAAELDASPFGILEDYPDECYPIDVFAAIACLRRADKVVGTDHRAFVERAIRAFQGDMLDERGLIPYTAEAKTGKHYESSRGVGNSYICIFAPELWPEQAEKWYDLYEKHFWQERWMGAGFREFPKDMPGHDWLFDVDSGPVIAGFSPAGNAFAVAAARINGRFDHAYVLASQVMTASWPLPDGSLLGARVLSDPVHAPHLGEAAILYLLTQQPAQGVHIRTGDICPDLFILVSSSILEQVR